MALLGLLLAATAGVVAAKDAYDYIVVGGGTAGTALATRLSQGLPNATVLLLEAGPAALDELRINVPGLRGSALGSAYDWNFTTVPQEYLDGRTVGVPRGKVLGGSSALNYLCYDRAAVAEYDAWGRLGNEGWSWNVMIDAMLRSENFTGDDGDRHGRSGPIKTVYNRNIPKALDTWKPTMNKLGVPTNDRSLGGDPIGVMLQPTNIDSTRWTRSYGANSYLPLAGANLEVRANTRVARVEFAAGKPLRATGVILDDGARIAAAKEVILSAGTVQTPGLLELSGIGQASVLGAAGVPLLYELPGVGENYQDHIRVSNAYRLKENQTSTDPLIYDNQGKMATEQLGLWMDKKASLYDLTSSAYSFVNWRQATANETTDAQLLRLAQADAGPTPGAVDRKKLDFLQDASVPALEIVMENNYVGEKGYPGGAFITIIATLMHPLSRGSVHVGPKAPHNPTIDPRYLSKAHDVRGLVEAAKFARRIAETEPMRSLWASEFEPGPEVKTDEQWRSFVVKAMESFYHPVGTSALLPEKDGGVVGPNLVVYGTANLRVVDASIIPVILSAHPQTAVYGIAEVAAQKIIQT